MSRRGCYETGCSLRVHGYVNIGPAIVVEIVGNGRNGKSRARFEIPAFSVHRERSVAVVVVENVGISR